MVRLDSECWPPPGIRRQGGDEIALHSAVTQDLLPCARTAAGRTADSRRSSGLAYNDHMTVHHLDRDGLDLLAGALRQELEPCPGVAFAYLFGSVLEPFGFHDVDVAVWTSAAWPRHADLELAARLASRTGLPLDVRIVNDAPRSFLFHVLRGRPVLVRDEQLLADLIERTAREYHDLAPLRRVATRDAFAA